MAGRTDWVALRAMSEDEIERLNATRARIRRSLDDPRPDLTGEEVQANLDAMFAVPTTTSDT